MELFKLESIRFMGNIRTIFKNVNAGGNPERPGQEPHLRGQVCLPLFLFAAQGKLLPHLSLCLFLSLGVLGTSVMMGPWLQILKRHISPTAQTKTEKHLYCLPVFSLIHPFSVSIVLSSNSGYDAYDSHSSSIIFCSLKSSFSTNIFFDHHKSPVK